MIDYVICAAGAGERMKTINPSIAKPKLVLRGRNFLNWSLQSLDFFPGDRVHLLVQRGVLGEVDIATFKKNYPGTDFFLYELSKVTGGQLETALLSKAGWRVGQPLVIFNSDTYFRSRNLLAQIHDSNAEGIIPCSKEMGDSWSFCKTGSRDDLAVSEVTEKKRISDWCSVGYYFFRNSQLFLNYVDRYLKGNVSAESYVAPIYNLYLNDGLTIEINSVDLFKPMGSLDQLQQYWGASLAEMRQENPRGKIVIDLDDTLTVDSSSANYSEKHPRKDVIEKVRKMKELGYEIVIFTARRMRTFGGDETKVMASIAHETIEWLRKHNVPFDGLKFGKPHAENAWYVDDKALRPAEFLALSESE